MKYEWCQLCIFYEGQQRCRAFPDGIPGRVFTWETPHTVPVPRDKGIQFEAMKSVDPEYLRSKNLPQAPKVQTSIFPIAGEEEGTSGI